MLVLVNSSYQMFNSKWTKYSHKCHWMKICSEWISNVFSPQVQLYEKMILSGEVEFSEEFLLDLNELLTKGSQY